MSQSIVAETAEKIFADLADPLTINRAQDGAWRTSLWTALTEAGLPLAWVDEQHGGSGVSIAEGFEIASATGKFAVPVPLTETMLAGWLLGCAGIASPDGVMTMAPARPKDRVSLGADGGLAGEARGIPFASETQHIAVLVHGSDGASVALVETKACQIVKGESVAGEPRDTVRFDKVRPLKVARASVDQTGLLLMGMAVRSVQIAGALQAALDMTVRYAGERVAFERQISKFQAVQHNLARLAGETAAASAASGSAADTIANAQGLDDDAVFLEAVSAKIRCAEAAETGAGIAHQVHGAIGFTQEHILHRFTLRMLSWRDDFGNESEWAVALGNKVAAAGADELWPMVAAR